MLDPPTIRKDEDKVVEYKAGQSDTSKDKNPE